jgi:ribonucleotide reductase alpha subunit
MKTLIESYLGRMGTIVIERPQHMFMRVSIHIHGADLPRVIQTYKLLSTHRFMHTPQTLRRAGYKDGRHDSSFSLHLKAPTLDGIYGTLTNCAQIIEHADGMGISIHNAYAARYTPLLDKSTTSANTKIISTAEDPHQASEKWSSCLTPRYVILMDVNNGNRALSLCISKHGTWIS